ncbi:DUF2255 family protein [Actinoplanes sp. NPDC051346]|uniref:DUF2255 family protein n=1 Tax=Actinoplanes sp. NPDC051346 TaxID=3155048 RepID=UPI0034361530
MSWDAPIFDELARAHEITIVVPAPGHEPIRAPIWIVAVCGDLYIRSWKGDAGRWFRRARHHGIGTISAGADDLPVRFVPAADPDLDAAIDRAYLGKYGASPYAAAMMRPPASETTLRVEPAADR